MKKSLFLFICSLAVCLASSARAEDEGMNWPERMKNDCMMDIDGMHGDCRMMGNHNVTGKVEKIDHVKGTLMLKNSLSEMQLGFPPAALRGISNGDTITVYLGFAKVRELND